MPAPRWELVSLARPWQSGMSPIFPMITIDERIARTERLLRRLEEDKPYLRARLSVLGAEHRKSAAAYADRVRAEAEAELKRLIAQRGSIADISAPQPAD